MIVFKNLENIYFIAFCLIWIYFLFGYSNKLFKVKRDKFLSSDIYNKISKIKNKPLFSIKNNLIIISIILLGFTMLRPLGESYEEEVKGSGLDLIVALDISKSMNALDINGNSRLYVAKIILRNLVNGLQNDRVGLVVFAGETMVQSPLTYDKNSFLTAIDRVDPSLLSEQGTNLTRAIQTAMDRFTITASQSKVILLLSDGEDPDVNKIKESIEEAKKNNIKIFTVGLGSKEGGMIPEYQDFFGVKYKRNKNGTYVISRISEKPLIEIAKGTNAKYFRASDVETANKVIENINSIKRVAVSNGKRIVRKELYWIPLLLAFLLLLIEWMIPEKKLLLN